jgi:hypothetical protein
VGNLSFALALATVTIIRFAGSINRDYTSDVHATANAFTTAIVSWNVVTPEGSWIETELRARIGERWTSWYSMGSWSADRAQGHRHSTSAPADANGKVDTDTLLLDRSADAWQLRIFLHPSPSGAAPALALVAVTTGPKAPPSTAPSQLAWGIDLDVPERTQRVQESPDALGGGGDAWCSPTSVSMVMAYWAAREHQPQWDVGVPAAADGTYDATYRGCGNWPFNVAYASEHGLAGWVERLTGLDDLGRYIGAGVPLVASIRVRPGELRGSPYAKTDGHLLVVRGFTKTGDVITNDPYALPGHIRIVYPRAQFEHVWMGGSGGIVYVIAPPALLAKFPHG